MPEETHYEVKDAYNDMKEETQDDKDDYQSNSCPYPWTDLREIDHFFLVICRGEVLSPYSWAGKPSPYNIFVYAVR